MTVSSRLFYKVLLTNDDGFDAPGLRTLTEVAEELAEEVWIVAPITIRAGRRILLACTDRCAFAEGRAQIFSRNKRDCVAMAIRMRPAEIWLLSGYHGA